MTNHKTLPLENLNLSWPQSIKYRADNARTPSSSLSGNREAKTLDTGSQKLVTTYNGVPRRLLRRVQTLLGNEIRLLNLRQGTRGDPLVGSLRKVRLSDPIVYEPLSYTWKDYDAVEQSDNNAEDNVRHVIFLSDVDLFMEIGANCAKALCSIRRSKTERTIWVDSICVNQDDPEERSRQVDLMDQIYSKAFTVLVYLGQDSTENDATSSIAMSLLRQSDGSLEFDGLSQRETTSLRRLFERRYFQRMWIVQEVALAQTLELYCGPDMTHISMFAGKSWEPILGSGLIHPPWLKHSKHTVGELSKPHTASQAEHILSLIFDTALCHCSDDRDRIFALLSLLNPSEEEQLRADYNLSTLQVYTGISAWLATNGFLWIVLMLAPPLALNSDSRLPSWVPDWKMLGNVGPQARKLLELKVLRRHTRELDEKSGVDSSGVITIIGMPLGPVTNSEYSLEHISQPLAPVDWGQLRSTESSNGDWTPSESSQWQVKKSIWTITRLNQEKPQGSWECHFEFMTRCKQPSNAQHLAIMLPDYLTVLILRRDDSFCAQYTLVEIGAPRVCATLPEDWVLGNNTRPQIPLHLLSPRSTLEQFDLDSVLLYPKEMFSRLADYPELWSHNPVTSTMSLTYKAMRKIQLTDLSELSLLEEWQKHARIGFQVLRDQNRLQLLIDEVNNLRHGDYSQIEKNAGLSKGLSFDKFLGLFIKNPFERELMAWPNVKSHGGQSLNQTALLPQLMQWAEVTDRFLADLCIGGTFGLEWLDLLSGEHLYSEAWKVGCFQVSIASDRIESDASHGLDRTSALLANILRQLLVESNPELEQFQEPRFSNECYWDWRKFETVMEQRLSVLNHIQPDVEKLQAYLRVSKPDFKTAIAQQVLAAHGIDRSKKVFTQIRIR